MATTAAYNAFKIVYADPAKEQASDKFRPFHDQYSLRWAFYTNSIFDRSYNDWLQLARNYGLYNKIRSLKNPVGATVDFYSQYVYPGGLSPDGKRLPDDMPTAMPFPDDTDEALMLAIAQIWQWSNWSSGKSTHVKKTAALGDNLIEVVDDAERGKVYYKEVWPGYVTDMVLDPQGNVKAYMLEYEATDSDNKKYKYRKVVTKEFTTEYKDDVVVNDYDNPYGFVPAYWFKFSDIGGTHGQIAFKSLAALMELNAKLSQVSDHVGKVIQAPAVLGNVASPKEVTKLFDKINTDARTRNANEYSGLEAPDTNRENMYLLTTPGAVDVKSLAGNLNIADALKFIEMINDEVDARNPEITYWDKLREMSQLTGPAADRLSGDVKGRLLDAQAAFDRGNIALAQMAVAIAGMRSREGKEGWRNRTRQQQKFNSFDLQSFERGDLDFSFAPRPLITPTALEKANEKLAIWNARKAAVDTGASLEFVLREDGVPDDVIAQLDTTDPQEIVQEKTDWWMGVQAAVGAGADLEFALNDFGMSDEQIAELNMGVNTTTPLLGDGSVAPTNDLPLADAIKAAGMSREDIQNLVDRGILPPDYLDLFSSGVQQ
jgi:hypothetical protein